MDIGAQLREAQEAHGLSLSRLSQRTRVPERALAAIERNDKSALPPHPFSRGFVGTYASKSISIRIELVRDCFAQFPEPPPAARRHGESRFRTRRGNSTRPGWDSPPHLRFSRSSLPLRWCSVARVRARTSLNPSARLARRRPRPRLLHRPPRYQRFRPRIVRRQPRPRHYRHRHRQRLEGQIVIALSTSRPCWVTATADGRRTIYRILQAGERETIAGDKEVKLRLAMREPWPGPSTAATSARRCEWCCAGCPSDADSNVVNFHASRLQIFFDRNQQQRLIVVRLVVAGKRIEVGNNRLHLVSGRERRCARALRSAAAVRTCRLWYRFARSPIV